MEHGNDAPCYPPDLRQESPDRRPLRMMSGPSRQMDRVVPSDRQESPANSPAPASSNSQVSLEGMHGTVSVPPHTANFWRQWRAFVGPAILVSVGYLDLGSWNTAVAGSTATKARDGSDPSSPPLPDKSRFGLFAPTPSEFMREMTTDRPDKTESPFTVDAGHFQLEMDLVSYMHDRETPTTGDTVTEALAFAPLNVRVGLLNSLEFDVMLETFNVVRIDDDATGVSQRMSGYGDTTLRLKYNVWGNDGGSTALATMPFVKIPSNQDGLGNHAVEGGVIFPLAIDLPRGWDAGIMTEADYLQNESNSGRHAAFINMITFGHDICGPLGGYVEFYSEVSTESGRGWIGTVDFGLTYKLTANLQLDAGINIGVTKAAPDFNPFVGLSWRF
jgi:hypothetical protein